MAADGAQGDGSMKLRVELDGAEYSLNLRKNNGTVDYVLTGAADPLLGAASIVPAGDGAYSVLIRERSYTVRISRESDYLSVHLPGRHFKVRVSDARDRQSRDLDLGAGPVDIRSQMPGKVVKLLVKPGEDVIVGQGLIVVEAMKMQNEITAPKAGTVKRVAVAEGGTVSAGEVLLVVA